MIAASEACLYFPYASLSPGDRAFDLLPNPDLRKLLSLPGITYNQSWQLPHSLIIRSCSYDLAFLSTSNVVKRRTAATVASLRRST
jgi:hypothetical protein